MITRRDIKTQVERLYTAILYNLILNKGSGGISHHNTKNWSQCVVFVKWFDTVQPCDMIIITPVDIVKTLLQVEKNNMLEILGEKAGKSRLTLLYKSHFVIVINSFIKLIYLLSWSIYRVAI